MAFDILKNLASIDGTYDNVLTTIVTPEISTNLISGFTATKTADKELWANGYLTYTIVVTNNAESNLETPALSDILDPEWVILVENSVLVDDAEATYTYDDQSGKLTVELPTLEAGTSVEVIFQVAKKA